jgi:hypothetical protein
LPGQKCDELVSGLAAVRTPQRADLADFHSLVKLVVFDVVAAGLMAGGCLSC